jgi:D-alanine-D-alanine ligase
MSTIRIGILRGGPSHEHEISLKSGLNISKNLNIDSPSSRSDNKKYIASDVFIDKKGQWHIGGIPKSPIDAINNFDVIVNSLHGSYGEDGALQRILEISGIPYVGNNHYASGATFNKSVFKSKIKELGIKTPLYREFNLSVTDDLEAVARELFSNFPLPAIVKPASGGASIGVGVATSFETLLNSLRNAVQYSNQIIVEEFIPGTEIVSGFVDGLRNQDTYILLPVVISNEEKQMSRINSKNWIGHLDDISRVVGSYSAGLSREIGDMHKKQIEEIVKKVKNHLGLRHYATFDFILSPRRGLYLIESDSSPHVHEESPMIVSLKEAGVSARDFFKHIVDVVVGK